MKVSDVIVLPEAANDLKDGKKFYSQKGDKVGDYFVDNLLSDIEALVIYAGIHNKHFGCYRMLSKRFPYAIYYEIEGKTAVVVAVLPMRRNPAWIVDNIKNRGK